MIYFFLFPSPEIPTTKTEKKKKNKKTHKIQKSEFGFAPTLRSYLTSNELEGDNNKFATAHRKHLPKLSMLVNIIYYGEYPQFCSRPRGTGEQTEKKMSYLLHNIFFWFAAPGKGDTRERGHKKNPCLPSSIFCFYFFFCAGQKNKREVVDTTQSNSKKHFIKKEIEAEVPAGKKFKMIFFYFC